MASQTEVQVEVVGDGIRTIDANAFRTLPDGADFLLDFVQSDSEGASVVSRIRVAQGFAPSILSRLKSMVTQGS